MKKQIYRGGFDGFRNTAENFWPRLRRAPNGCWVWVGARNKDGYGIIRWSGQQKKVHRISWFLTFGEIPKGREICHKCDNPPCCNPKHLFLGTHRQNLEDSVQKGRQPQAKISAAQAVAVRAISRAGVSTKQLSKELGIHVETVRDILKRRTWKHVP